MTLEEKAYPRSAWADYPGMDLRDYFAAHALTMLNYDAVKGKVSPAVIAEDAYKIADAMMIERLFQHEQPDRTDT